MILIKEGNPRTLVIGDDEIIGGNNRVGIYAHQNDLYFDGNLLSTSTVNKAGIVVIDDSLYFNGELVSGEAPPVSVYWTPPAQASNVAGRYWTYAEIISKYDALCLLDSKLTKHRYEDSLGNPILSTAGSYELFHYKFEPDGYDKTFFINAQIHGNEKDCRLTIYRIFEILIKERNNLGYSRFKDLYNRARLIVIPVASPWGNDNSKMNVPYEGAEHGLNMNRNYDFNHQYGIPGAGVGGNTPFEYTEVQHVRDVIDLYGAENIDYAYDHHDGGDVLQHYWINYSVDNPIKDNIMDFIGYLIDKYNIENPVIPNCRDTSTTGSGSRYLRNTLGLTGSTVEWIGGYLGYDFLSAHLTQSLEIRANMLFMGLDNDVKQWKIDEAPDADYFHWDYPKAFTRDTLRLEGAASETKVTDEMIYGRWDDIASKHPLKITKSPSLGNNAQGMSVHTYTFGNGGNKVMYVGGVMRYGGTHKIDEYAIYQLVEYLCNDYIVNQSEFLKDLRDNYTIIVLPCIDNVAGNNTETRDAGLNSTVLNRQRWVIDINDKTVPAANENGIGNYGVQIIKSLIDSNTDLKCVVSGGEIMGGYSLNPIDYTEDYQAQFILPRNMMSDITDYTNHLTTNRGELVDVDNTQGATWGDYTYDHFSIPVYFVQQKVSDRFTDLAEYHTLTEEQYIHNNYEAGRRMANIVNLFVK